MQKLKVNLDGKFYRTFQQKPFASNLKYLAEHLNLLKRTYKYYQCYLIPFYMIFACLL